MKTLWICFTVLLFGSLCFANPHFMSSRDLGPLVAKSNIKLKNTRTSAKTVYGLYVRQLSYILPGQSCSSSTIIYPATNNISAGAIAMAVNIAPSEEADIGPGLLYNMIYGAQYYVQIIIPSSPPGCFLPGCTWGADTINYKWCVQIGALAPVTMTPGFTTANILPNSDSVSNGSYNFNLVTTYEQLGPISCNDQTLTCSVTSAQTQSF